MLRSARCLLALALLSTGLLHADHPAAPDGAAIEGSEADFLRSFATTQNLYVAADLTGLNIGDIITGISLRLDGGSPALPSLTSFLLFDIRLGVGKASLTNTFADNFAGPTSLVRSGLLSFGASSFPSGGNPNSFGEVIQFTAPYTYAGGNLLMEIRFSPPSTSFSVDALSGAEGANGQSAFRGSADATSAESVSVGINWAIAFEVTRAGAAATERIAIPDGAAAEGNNGTTFQYNSGLSYQMRYRRAQLESLNPGDLITGIGFRLNNPVTGFLSTTFARFDIRMGPASVGPSTAIGTTFASSFAEAPDLVRSGPMTLFLEGISGNPNPFATRPIHFVTPHTYTGGPLLFETRSSSQTTPLAIDTSTVSGYGGGLYNTEEPDALFGDVPDVNANWAMELHVLRDKTAPAIVFLGKSKLKRGRARVRGTVIEAGTVGTIYYNFTSKQSGSVSVTAAAQSFDFPIRTRFVNRKVKATVIATDASGNSTTARRVYRP